MNRRKNITRHALATLAGGLAALLASEPVPTRTPSTARVEAVANGAAEDLAVREMVRWVPRPAEYRP